MHEQTAFFQENGYCVLPNVLGTDDKLRGLFSHPNRITQLVQDSFQGVSP